MPILLVPAVVDWPALARQTTLLKLTRGGCHWVSFASVAECLREGRLEDAAQPQTPESNHAARIASLVRLIERRTPMEQMVLNIVRADPARDGRGRRLSLWFEDGSHRFRAHEFLGSLGCPLPVILRGEPLLVAEAVRLARGAIEPAVARLTAGAAA